MCPGFVDTDFHENNGMYVDKTRKGMFGFRQPGEVVDEAMKEFEKGSIVCVPDKAGKLVKAMAEYMPKKMYYRFADDFVNKNIRKNWLSQMPAEDLLRTENLLEQKNF